MAPMLPPEPEYNGTPGAETPERNMFSAARCGGPEVDDTGDTEDRNHDHHHHGNRHSPRAYGVPGTVPSALM